MSLRAIGRREDDRPGRMTCIRDEHLRPVQDVVVADAFRRRLDAGGVRAGIGLGKGEGAENGLVEERRQPLPLLLVRPGEENRGPPRACSPRSRRPMPAQPQESSSPMSMPANVGRPSPPYSAGMCGFISPTSWAWAITSAGCVCRSSYSAAFGRISFSANSRASARSCFCSSVNAKEIPPTSPSRVWSSACSVGNRLTSQSILR